MSTEIYFSAALLGVFLALICILGWRRIVPCIMFFCFVLGSASLTFAQYDDDNDVPAINEVRDALLAQKLMLDNYFSGYTSPNKLNDISNALYKSGNPVLTTIDNRLDILVDSQHTSGISSAVFLYDIQQYIQGNYSGPLTSLAGRTFDSDDDVPKLEEIRAILASQVFPSGPFDADDDVPKLTDIENRLIGIENLTSQQIIEQMQTSGWTNFTFTEVQQLHNLLNGYGQWDTDDDVPTLQNIQLGVTDLDLHNTQGFTALLAKLEEVKLATENINYDDGSINPVYTPDPETVTAPTWTPPDASQLPIEDNIDNEELGGLADIPSITGEFTFPPGNFDSDDVPLYGGGIIPGFTAPALIGGTAVQDNINYKMNENFDKAAVIIKPIFTCFLMWLVVRWTTTRTINLVAV